MENNLYKQAILDAKAIRAGAIANAKASLEEVIGPKINELVRLNLQEDLEEDMDGTEEVYSEENHTEEENSDNLMEDNELEEILAELNSLEEESLEESFDYLSEADEDEANEDEDEANEDEDEANEDEDEANEDEADDEEADDEEADEADDINDDTKVVDITLGDLKDILKSVMGSGSSTDMEFSGDEENSDMNPDKEDLNLDEILAELENNDLEEKINEVRRKKSNNQKDASEKNKELNEARKTIKSLSSTLNEVNLLNAKLLYVNKIFKEKSLNESQKLKVIKSFDKATNTREAKNVYEILKESLNTKQKTSLKESIGFASQSRGYIKNNNIIESDPFVSRWQKIAGIKN
jgi:hypothetical protein